MTPPNDNAEIAIYRIILITGDIVLVMVSQDGMKSFAIQPIDPREQFISFKQGNDTYIIPSSARLNKLDLSLFNVDYLLREKYYRLAYLPVLVSSDSKSALQNLAAERAVRGSMTRIFNIISAFAAKPKIPEVRGLYEALLGKPEVKKIWLDKVNHVILNESAPLIGAPSAWAAGYDGSGIKIAILDTGIDSTHHDVSGRIVAAVDMTDDGTTDDLYGHGTHVAVIAAGSGVASGGKFKGVAPAASLMNIKVLNQYGSGLDSWIIAGIEYATANGADIVSMSLGKIPSDGNDPLSLAVDAAVASGVVVSVAAGNEANYLTVESPGAARQAITVGASDKSDTLAWFSSYGPTLDFRVKPDVLAPGVNIISGHAANGQFPFIPNPPGQPSSGPPNYPPYYTTLSGTSMATPHVSGLIALIKQRNPTWTPVFIKDALINTAVQLDGYNIYEQGGGRVSAPEAVQTTMLMDPGSFSFGVLSAELPSAYCDFAVYNFGGSTITVSLSITLVDVQTGLSYSSAVTLNVTSLYIPNGLSKGVRLTLNLTPLPTSLYSGFIYAAQTITGGKTIHSVFGFAKLWPATVTKLNRQGSAAYNNDVYAFKTNAVSGLDFVLNYRWLQLTDANGIVTLWLADGTYTFTSFDWDVVGMTVAENVEINARTTLTLDERNNMCISFDPALSNQQIASVKFRLSFELPYGGGNILFFDFVSLSSRHPPSSDMYVSVTSAHALFNYQYFPASAYNAVDPTLIDAPSWGDLQYYSHGVSSPMLFVADYGQVVQRVSQYSLKLSSSRRANILLWPRNKDWVDGQLARGRWFWFDLSWSWDMTFHQRRTEFLSPNTYYYQWVDSYVPGTGYYEWGFVSPLPIWNPDVRETSFGRVWRPGESFEEIWNGILSSELNLYVYSPDYVRMFGSVFIDGYLHHFQDFTRPIAGSLTVRKGDLTLFSSSLPDLYDLYSVPISGFGTYVLNIHGTQSQSLSTETSANFTLNIGSEGPLVPPLIEFRSDQVDLNNAATGQSVRINLRVETPSSVVTDVSLQYSTDDGASWTSVQLTTTADPRLFVADLPVSTSGYVSLWAGARDGNGNAVSQIVKRAFAYVSGATTVSFFHPHTEFWFTWYDKVDTEICDIHFVNTGTSTATITVYIAGSQVDSFTLGASLSTYMNYPVNNGPVHVVGTQPLWVTKRVVGWGGFKEVYGLPGDVASTDIYYTWYDFASPDVTTDKIYLTNPSGSSATAQIYIGGSFMKSVTLSPGESKYEVFPGVMNGPVRITSNIAIFSTQLVIGWSDFDEIVGTPSWYVATEHYFTWYDLAGASIDNIHIINLGGSTAQINIYIAGLLKTSTPISLPSGEQTYVNYPGVIGGPVRIVSDQPIRVTQRIVGWEGFKEVFSVSSELLASAYYFTWYDWASPSVTWDALHFMNPSTTQTAHITVTIGGTVMGTVTLNPGQAGYVTYQGTIDGPILITSDISIMTTQRILGWSSFEESIGVQWT